MNVYDFDETLFNPDSSFLFSITSLIRKPKAFFAVLPGFIAKSLGRLIGTTSVKTWKEHIFSFLSYYDNTDAEVAAFWEKHFCEIESWYLAQKRDDDIIISASPEFLLKPVCEKLGVRLIATRMDKRTGLISGENCSGSEKVRRLFEEIPDAVIDKFYSDSRVDTPLAKLAKEAFLVDHDKIRPWRF